MQNVRYDMLDWNINPRTGQSMNTIISPYGTEISANVFLSMPKDLFFLNSQEYCCKGTSSTNYTVTMLENNTKYNNDLASLRPCCTNNY